MCRYTSGWGQSSLEDVFLRSACPVPAGFFRQVTESADFHCCVSVLSWSQPSQALVLCASEFYKLFVCGEEAHFQSNPVIDRVWGSSSCQNLHGPFAESRVMMRPALSS